VGGLTRRAAPAPLRAPAAVITGRIETRGDRFRRRRRSTTGKVTDLIHLTLSSPAGSPPPPPAIASAPSARGGQRAGRGRHGRCRTPALLRAAGLGSIRAITITIVLVAPPGEPLPVPSDATLRVVDTESAERAVTELAAVPLACAAAPRNRPAA
jgi:hypothetical protein